MIILSSKQLKNNIYFDGDDSGFDINYLKKRLCKKKFLLEYERGETIISQGETVDSCFFLEDGFVIAYEVNNGKRRIFDAMTGCNMLLCSHAIYDHPSNFTYEARDNCRIYSISLSKVKKLLQNDTNFIRAFIYQTTRDLLVCQDLLRKSAIHNVSWLVSDFLLIMAARDSVEKDGIIYLNNRFTQKHIADMLFINRITCFKELHKLEDLKLITLQSAYIGIRSIEGLEAYRESCATVKKNGSE